MKIVFLLPGAGYMPVGGYKVVYEYANALTSLNHSVSVLHAPNQPYLTATIRRKWRCRVVYCLRSMGFVGGYRPTRWFKIDPRVKLLWRPSLHPSWVPAADACIATAWQTAEWLATYPPEKGRKFYLVQGFEANFRGVVPRRVEATWRLPLQKIVISKWLQEHATQMGEESTLIPNGLDFDRFNIEVPIADRDPARVLMLYHPEPLKGTAVGLAALRIVKEHIPELSADLFGTPRRPSGLDPWITYKRLPPADELKRLYNTAAVFIAPSFSEGWGLTATEALQCGAALCATDIGGHREFALHDKTALLSPAGDARALAANVELLIGQAALRQRLAAAGNLFVRQFTWQRAARSLEEALNG